MSLLQACVLSRSTSQNLNIDTNVEEIPHPARKILNFPRDGGFGQTANKGGGFGNDAFNVASVVEAADTPPFFHNNVLNTLEEVVSFYVARGLSSFEAPVQQGEDTAQILTVL